MENNMAGTTITIPEGSALDEELDRLATETGQPKEEIALDALIEWIQDQADARGAADVLARNKPTTSLEEIGREFGLR
jgi:predicted transcriptional regulator